MVSEIDLPLLRSRLSDAHKYLRIAELRGRREQLEELAGAPDLWDNQAQARSITRELAEVSDELANYDQLAAQLDDAEALAELVGDLDSLQGANGSPEADLLSELAELAQSLTLSLERLELRSLLAGEYDERDAVCQIQAGEGGTDAQDWAEMLLRMYLRWAEQRGLQAEVLSVREGTEAGILSAEFMVRGRHAYGLLQSEHGIHRLVRISPFNKEGKRHTSFSSMNVVPYFDEVANEVEIDESDLRIDTYRSSGAGGQHVNVTDSAVRITHLPSGIVTSCQNERSQHQNKEQAMLMLSAKLLDLERRRQQAEIQDIAGKAQNVGFGNQIRSYVMQPFQLVKDLRTAYETSNFDAVLDGGLDSFIEAYLQWQRASEPAAAAVEGGGAQDAAASETVSVPA